MNRTLVGRAAALLIGLGATATAAFAANAVPVKLDEHHTSATFTIQHLTITKVSGSVPLLQSNVAVDANGIPAKATASFDLRKIDTHDEKRDTDLRSDKWFNTAAYPVMTFAATKITPEAGNKFTMAGNLTMHGQTHPVTLAGTYAGKAKDPMGMTHMGYSATGKIDRTAWGVGAAPAAIVGNDVDITIETEALAK